MIPIPYILGDNIGTTITAQLAALRSSRNAKRVGMGHTLFNIIGVMYILPLVMSGWFGQAVQWLTPGELSQTNIMFHLGTDPLWSIAEHRYHLNKLFANTGYRIALNKRMSLELNATYNLHRSNDIITSTVSANNNTSDILGERTLYGT